MNVWIIDIEVFSNFFCYTGKNRDTKEVVQFIITNNRNNLKNLLEHLKSVKGQIGYNNLNYDYPIIHYLITHNFESLETAKLTNLVYNKSKEIIESKYSSIRKPLIPQLDLYRIWHFDNLTKATSLKGIECAMRFDNIEDLPFSPDYSVKDEDINKILSYNLNDVNATEAFSYITLGETKGEYDSIYKNDNKIQLRKDIQKEFGIECINYNDVKIGEEINKKYYLLKTGKSWWDIKDIHTDRKVIEIKDLIPKSISFKTKELQDFLSEILQLSFKPDEKFKRKFEFAGLKIKFKKGGLHATSEDKLIIPEESQILCEYDVSSMYPAIIINQKIYPEHLGIEALEIYKQLYEKRIEIKKTNKLVSAALKLALNGGFYGKLGAKNSWLKDKLALYKVTFFGQLSILMLVESYFLSNIKVISINTDGIVILFSKDKLAEINKINNEWQELTKYNLEPSIYKKLIQKDINNYIAVKESELKYKGCFLINPEIHQNHSHRIIAIALKEYFINGISIEKTIKENNDIFNFCCFAKKRGESRFEIRYENEILKLPKTLRYYVSNQGGILVKVMPPLDKKIKEAELTNTIVKDREISIQKNYKIIIFNKFIKKEIIDYNINYDFYISKCQKIIKSIMVETYLNIKPNVKLDGKDFKLKSIVE